MSAEPRPLTTNDVRVLRVLVDGAVTPAELRTILSRQPLGLDAGLRRVPGLKEQGLVDRTGGVLDITGKGIRALWAADRTAYGSLA